jgi:hypothetical protein
MSNYGPEWDKFFPEGKDFSKIRPKSERNKPGFQSDPWQMIGVIGFDEHKKQPFIIYDEVGLFREPLFALAIFSRPGLSESAKEVFYTVFAKFQNDGSPRELMIAFDTPFDVRTGRLVDSSE